MSLRPVNPDPREAMGDKYKPPFLPQSQDPEGTGLESRMTPKPDYGLESYRGLGRLKGKVALITGGDSGIGRAVALAYAREGADVAINYLESEVDAEEAREAVESSGRTCVLVKGDISQDAICRDIIDRTVAVFGRIDILVNNAAFQGKAEKDFTKIDHERVLRTFKTNIVSMFSLVRYAVPHIPAGGSIINTSSIEAYQPDAPILDYAVTKGAIVNFTKGLAQTLIEKGIRVNSVAPGPVWTPIVAASFPAAQVATFGPGYSPLKRPAQPVELAPAFVYLASQEAQYVVGEILAVTGGTPTM